jgi:hypothetical protein
MADVSYFAPGPSALPSPNEARESLAKMVAVIVKTKGYDGIQSTAMDYILNNLESCECIEKRQDCRALKLILS